MQRADDVQVGDVARVVVTTLLDPAQEDLAVNAMQRSLRHEQEH